MQDAGEHVAFVCCKDKDSYMMKGKKIAIAIFNEVENNFKRIENGK